MQLIMDERTSFPASLGNIHISSSAFANNSISNSSTGSMGSSSSTTELGQHQQFTASDAEAESHYAKLETIDLQDFVEQNNATLSFPEKVSVFQSWTDLRVMMAGELKG